MGNPISRETFLDRARSRFGDDYDYTGIVYKSFKTPIRIRCRKHPVKEISITPERHLQTTGGCKYCLREKRIRILEHELGLESALPPQVLPSSPQQQSVGAASCGEGEAEGGSGTGGAQGHRAGEAGRTLGARLDGVEGISAQQWGDPPPLAR